MDELARALGRKYHREPSPENAAPYIRSLERIWGGASDPCLLLDIWGSLILGLFDPNGINLAVYDSLLRLTTLLFGNDASLLLSKAVGGEIDGAFSLREVGDGQAETWFDNFLLGLNYKCCHPTTCKVSEHHQCEAFITTGRRCPCPGCYLYDMLTLDYQLGSVDVCWHHYQILTAHPRIEFEIDFPSGPDF